MAVKKPGLIVVAHPDDETIFFGGLLMNRRKRPWHVVCVTNGNADGRGTIRRREFLRACRLLKVAKAEMWDFADIYEKRINTVELVKRLLELTTPHEVFTHGVLGEYGHPHHQDVSASVHRAFGSNSPVWSVAYNCWPELVVRLDPSQFERKTQILTKVYGTETRRFAHLLPATGVEGFSQVSLNEINAIYNYLTTGRSLGRKELQTYRWFLENLRDQAVNMKARPF